MVCPQTWSYRETFLIVQLPDTGGEFPPREVIQCPGLLFSISLPEVENPDFTAPYSQIPPKVPPRGKWILIDLKVNNCRGAIKTPQNSGCEWWSPDSHTARVLRYFLLESLLCHSDWWHEDKWMSLHWGFCGEHLHVQVIPVLSTLKILVYSKSPLGNVPRIQMHRFKAGAIRTEISGSTAKEVVQFFCHVAYRVICR